MSGVTQYGFQWGPLEVQRTVHVEGRGYVVTVQTERESIQVYVSEKGRTLKAYPKHKRYYRKGQV